MFSIFCCAVNEIVFSVIFSDWLLVMYRSSVDCCMFILCLGTSLINFNVFSSAFWVFYLSWFSFAPFLPFTELNNIFCIPFCVEVIHSISVFLLVDLLFRWLPLFFNLCICIYDLKFQVNQTLPLISPPNFHILIVLYFSSSLFCKSSNLEVISNKTFISSVYSITFCSSLLFESHFCLLQVCPLSEISLSHPHALVITKRRIPARLQFSHST